MIETNLIQLISFGLSCFSLGFSIATLIFGRKQ